MGSRVLLKRNKDSGKTIDQVDPSLFVPGEIFLHNGDVCVAYGQDEQGRSTNVCILRKADKYCQQEK